MKALSLDENDAECQRLLCDLSMHFLQLDPAKFHADRALALNPNDPRIIAQQGEVLTWLGRAEEGIRWIETALRLDPLNVNERAHLMGRALYACRRYTEAIEAFKQRTKPRRGHLAEFAACYAQAGMETDAQRQAAAELQLGPNFSITKYVERLPFAEAADRDHLVEGLRKAGLPE